MQVPLIAKLWCCLGIIVGGILTFIYMTGSFCAGSCVLELLLFGSIMFIIPSMLIFGLIGWGIDIVLRKIKQK